MKRPPLQGKQLAVLQMTFGTRKVFGTFEKRTPELDLNSIADIRVGQVLLCGIRFCLLGGTVTKITSFLLKPF